MSESKRPTQLAFSGEQTIRNCTEARDRLLAALAESDAIDIDCRSVTEVDLSFVQIIFAARRSADATGRRLRLSAPADRPLRDILYRGGFVGGDAAAGSADDAFWTTVENGT